MAGQSGDVGRLLFAAAIGHKPWPLLLGRVAEKFSAVGAILTPLDKVYYPSSMYSKTLDGYVRRYFSEGWNKSDPRERHMPRLIKLGVTTNFDFASEEEMSNEDFWTKLYFAEGLRWMMGIHFRLQDEIWCLNIHRAAGQPCFSDEDKQQAAQMIAEISRAAAISRKLGLVYGDGLLNALQVLGWPALLLDKKGDVLASNAEMVQTLRYDTRIQFRKGKLIVSDDVLSKKLKAMVQQAINRNGREASTLSCAIESGHEVDYSLEIVPLFQALHNEFEPARALMMVTRLRQIETVDAHRLASTFKLTNAESAFVQKFQLLEDVAEAATELGIAKETARTHLRSIFTKTNTRKQGELISLLARLGPKPKIIKSYTIDAM